MSKSLGNVVNPMDMADRYGVDAFRYFLLAEMSLGQDANFTEDAFIRRLNADLANDLGNLLSRLLKLIVNGCDGQIPEAPDALAGAPEKALWAEAQETVDALEPLLAALRPDQAIAKTLSLVKSINRYLEETQPWRLAKQDDRAPLNRTLVVAAETLRVAAALLSPVMPGKMAELQKALGCAEAEMRIHKLRTFGRLLPGTPIAAGAPLFPRAERPVEPTPETPVAKIAPPAPKAAKAVETPPAEITYDDFAKVDLRVAVVTAAELVEGADKLLRLQIEIAGEPRQIVAGVAQSVPPEEMVGKRIVVVANLKPAKIRGVESRGMLLAAGGDDGKLRVLSLDEHVPSGMRVK